MAKSSYVPAEGDIVWIDFNPQAGRRPGFVVSPKGYNKIGMALLCPVTNAKKGYPFEVVIPGFGGNTTGVILSDHIRSMDWKARKVLINQFYWKSKIK